jgi:uncharacterized membrane protein
MNVALWIAQGLLAIVFLVTGATKVFTSREALRQRAAWTNDFTATQIKLLGMLELLGAVGLVVPWLVRILQVLTPAAALALAILMGGASSVHLRRHEPPSPPITLAVLALFVAAGRLTELSASGRLPW